MSNQFSYSAIHTFTVVTQTLSFSRAATTLHITPSAVSHQMKLLEAHIGVPLFKRQAKGVGLTDAGHALMHSANKGISLIQVGVANSIAAASQRSLHIAAIPSLAQNWLIPRLSHFYKVHPDINVIVHAQDQLVDFSTAPIDAHLHFGDGYAQQAHAQFLANEYIYPVCHPQLLLQKSNADIQHLIASHALLQYDAAAEDAPSNVSWQMWLKKLNITTSQPMQHRHFSHVTLALEAAKHQQGLALAWHHIVDNDIKSETLVRCHTQSLKLDYSYYLVSPEQPEPHSDLAIFATWVRDQFQHMTANEEAST